MARRSSRIQDLRVSYLLAVAPCRLDVERRPADYAGKVIVSRLVVAIRSASSRTSAKQLPRLLAQVDGVAEDLDA